MLPKMAELGLLALAVPDEYGGLGKDWRSAAVAHERLARYAGIIATLFNTTVAFGAMSLLSYGTPTQKRELLPRLVKGKVRFALALTDAGAGSDAAAISTTVRRIDGGWRIQGRKQWISNADAAHYIVVAAREPGSQSSKGISTLLVPRATAGISMTILPKVGHHCMPSYDIAFDSVEVPEDALMGEEGSGLRNLMSTLQYSRSGQAANSVGQSQRAVDIAVAYAKERVQFGKPISSFQTIAHKLAEIQIRVNQARLALYHLACLIATCQPCHLEAAQAKLVASETFQYVTREGMQIMASAGYALESEMQRMWRDAGLFTFGEGSSELQRNIIAREMGL